MTDEALLADSESSQVALPGLPEILSAAVSGDSEGPARNRSLPPAGVPGSLGRDQPQPPGETGRHRRSHGGATLSAFSPTPGGGAGRWRVSACARHKVYDVVRGRSEVSLENYLSRLRGKDRVRVICMDLSSTYRAIARKHFPNAMIVTDRFHDDPPHWPAVSGGLENARSGRLKQARPAVADAPPRRQSHPGTECNIGAV